MNRRKRIKEQQKVYYLSEKGDDKPASQGPRITLKDLLIPLVSAFAAVGFNQMNFRENRVFETELELTKENFKTQRPIINRILGYTYKREFRTIVFVQTPQIVIKTINRSDNSVIKTEVVADTANSKVSEVKTLGFVVNERAKAKLLNTLNYMKENAGNLDFNVYQACDDLISFFEDHPLPLLGKNTNIYESEWIKPQIQTNWLNLIDVLQKACTKKLNTFYEIQVVHE